MKSLLLLQRPLQSVVTELYRLSQSSATDEFGLVNQAKVASTSSHSLYLDVDLETVELCFVVPDKEKQILCLYAQMAYQMFPKDVVVELNGLQCDLRIN